MDEDDPFKDISPQQFLAWLEEQPPTFRTDILQIMLKRATEALIENVRTLWELAVDPNASDRVRGEAKWVLQETGFDDESLKKEKG
jgi:hypothetical protein